MKGQRYLVATLTRWKDNSVAEIMDSEDPIHSIYLGSTGKPKEWFTLVYMVYTAYTLKMFSIMKKTISFGVRLIGWITGHSYILYGPLLNGATVILRGTFVS
jgi:acetyl-CoA synthetase